MHEDIQDIRIIDGNIADVVCCPGGKEIEGQKLSGDLNKTLSWRRSMIEEGMTGFISYKGDDPRGFIEYMPGETAPFPVYAPNDMFLMCYHWIGDEGNHLGEERRLLGLMIEDVMDKFDGIAAMAWNHDVHFPIELLRTYGFEIVEEVEYGALMWLPFTDDAESPSLIDVEFELIDSPQSGTLSVKQGYSSRCPYSIHNFNKVKGLIDEIGDDRIVYNSYQIDTREQALKYCIEPLNWDWLYLNGVKIDSLFTSKEELKKDFIKMLDELD